MKKTLISILTCCLLSISLTPIKASDTMRILVHIKNAQDVYLIELQDNVMKVKTISSSLYLPIPPLNNEKAMIKEIDFGTHYDSLVDTINNSFKDNIKYYVSIDMPTLLKHLKINKNTYNYKTLNSLNKVSKQILKHLNIPTLIDYQNYIDTNLGYKQLYAFYKYFKKDNFTTKYYYLQYFVIHNNYLLMNKQFHLKK